MDNDIKDMDWIPVVGYPGYEVSGYGMVCKIRRDGSREILTPYRDKKKDRHGNRWVYYTLYKNFQHKKVALREIMKTTWMPEIERRKKMKDQPVVQTEHKEEHQHNSRPVQKPKRTTDKNEQVRKLKEMVDGYEPEKMSASAYMKYLREQGYRFTSSQLSAELSKKKRLVTVEKENNELF